MLSTNCVGFYASAITREPGGRNEIWTTSSFGLCYHFKASADTFFEGQLPGATDINQPRLVHVYCHQDAEGIQTWYAFAKPEHRKLFLDIFKAEKVGPSTALKIMCENNPDTILELIDIGDRQAFIKLKGVGPKTGEKLVKILFAQAPPQGPTKVVLDEQAVAALRTLGYDAKPAKEAVAEAMKQLVCGSSTEEILRLSLNLLSR